MVRDTHDGGVNVAQAWRSFQTFHLSFIRKKVSSVMGKSWVPLGAPRSPEGKKLKNNQWTLLLCILYVLFYNPHESLRLMTTTTKRKRQKLLTFSSFPSPIKHIFSSCMFNFLEKLFPQRWPCHDPVLYTPQSNGGSQKWAAWEKKNHRHWWNLRYASAFLSSGTWRRSQPSNFEKERQ